MLEEQRKNRDAVASPRNEVLSHYFGMMSRSSQDSGKKFSNYLRGSSRSKGDKLILAGSGLASMSPDVRKRLIGESVPHLESALRGSSKNVEKT